MSGRANGAAPVGVGLVGLGFMGRTHLDVYRAHPDARVVAVADRDPDRLTGGGRLDSNIAGAGEGTIDLATATLHPSIEALLDDPAVDAVDVCVPTPDHADIAAKAIRAGKHVIIEKPVARTAAEADALVALAAAHPDLVVMPAMCIRYWPGWTWLRDVVRDGTFGDCRALHVTRLGAALPADHYRDGRQSGGAILDLHLHDTDFVQFVFGAPTAVQSAGHSILSGEIDHVITRYHVPNDALVTAEGGWIESPSFPFNMRYRAHFEAATVLYDNAAADPLRVYRPDVAHEAVPLPDAFGYAGEIDAFLQAIRTGVPPRDVTLAESAHAIRIVEAEVASVQADGARIAVAQAPA